MNQKQKSFIRHLLKYFQKVVFCNMTFYTKIIQLSIFIQLFNDIVSVLLQLFYLKQYYKNQFYILYNDSKNYHTIYFAIFLFTIIVIRIHYMLFYLSIVYIFISVVYFFIYFIHKFFYQLCIFLSTSYICHSTSYIHFYLQIMYISPIVMYFFIYQLCILFYLLCVSSSTYSTYFFTSYVPFYLLVICVVPLSTSCISYCI